MNKDTLEKLRFFIFAFILGILAVGISFLFSLFIKSLYVNELNMKLLLRGMENSIFIGVFVIITWVKKKYNYNFRNIYNFFKFTVPFFLGAFLTYIALLLYFIE